MTKTLNKQKCIILFICFYAAEVLYPPLLVVGNWVDSTNITPQGGVFVYVNKLLRQSFTELVIRKLLSFNYFDNEDLTTVI
ncbi:hypothetical protein OSB04_011487 [Centaurea solstitialis]|uniref:Uncharacterized protein n=1 Tax=Centaurea solstitialis TaxID=347529 RepID=A0AA38T9I1_9ASTR|nr:hypothetical protein OSB04_011487 [Centaurea solstitialis]